MTNDKTSTLHAANNNAVTLAAVRAVIDRQIAELRALAGSPSERALLAQIATQAIARGLSGQSRGDVA